MREAGAAEVGTLEGGCAMVISSSSSRCRLAADDSTATETEADAKAEAEAEAEEEEADAVALTESSARGRREAGNFNVDCRGILDTWDGLAERLRVLEEAGKAVLMMEQLKLKLNAMRDSCR